jgi:hypothetical protein
MRHALSSAGTVSQRKVAEDYHETDPALPGHRRRTVREAVMRRSMIRSTIVVAMIAMSCVAFAADSRTAARGIVAGSGAVAATRSLPDVPRGIVVGDCDDTNSSIHPDQDEVVGNRFDDDCDQLADEDQNNNPSKDSGDIDGDGQSIAAGDCNDTLSSVSVGASEIPDNFRDDDCDGLADEDAQGNPSTNADDLDDDGFTIGSDRIFESDFEV